MRARSGWASALAILASDVSPAGRCRLLPDEVLELVGMVARKRTRQRAYNAGKSAPPSANAPNGAMEVRTWPYFRGAGNRERSGDLAKVFQACSNGRAPPVGTSRPPC